MIEWLEARSVTRTFGATVALRGVSVRFEAGSISLLEGPNGAGKSTLLAVLGTALTPTRGEVWYGALGAEPKEARRHIGWVSHESRCYLDLSARENVELAARCYGVEPGAAWAGAARRLELEPYERRAVRTLSRGQRQRVAVARAMVHAPSVLLLDEAWTGLDRASCGRLDTVVAEERARGVIVIVVSHDAGVAERLRCRRVRLERGRLVEVTGAAPSG